MSTNQQYDNRGIATFLANKDGKHNFIESQKRPCVSTKITHADGSTEYWSQFINTRDPRITCTIKAGTVTIKFPTDINIPIFSNDGEPRVFAAK